MKRILFTVTAYILTMSLTAQLRAQEYTNNNYYYNNFDGGTLGSSVSQIGAQSALAISDNSPLAGGYSLGSTGNGTAGGFDLSFLPNNTNLDNTDWGYEWTFVYRNNGGNTNNADNIANGTNLWQYWLLGDNANVNQASGYYITHKGNTLMLRYRVHNNGYPYYADGPSYTISNNKTYAVRVQRSKRGSQHLWMMFVDEYTANVKEASTRRGNLWYHYAQNLYRNSSLRVSSSTANRFVFDEMKMYSMQLLISGANDASNGISSSLYANQQNAVLYGLQMQTRGFFDIYQFKVELTGSLTSVIDNNTVKLNKSTDGYFGNTDDAAVISFTSNNVYNGAIQYYGDANNPFSGFWSVGNADGSMATAGYYFITANVKSNPSGTFAFSGAPLIKSGNTEVNYPDNAGTTVDLGTGNTNSGSVKDWVGTTTNWNTASNWLPSGVPGANDLARIGVSTFTNQPTVSNNATVGNIQFGTAKVATLTVNSDYTLTVKNTVENLEGITIAGAGTLDIQGTYLAKPTAAAKTTTASITNLNAVNFMLNTASKAVTFKANGNVLIKNVLQTSGANAATFTLGSGAALTLTGANPFSLAAATNTVTLSNGTVVYGAAVQQNVSTAFSYKNIGFSGAGIKNVASGTLNISGNWHATGGKIDLTSKGTSVVFNGVQQSIVDEGTDAGKGVIFKNVAFNNSTKTFSGAGKFSVAPKGVLSMGENTVLYAGGKLILKADATGFTQVAPIPASSSIQGEVTVENYIQGGDKNMWRTYRMLSSPVYDNTSAFINTDVVGNRTYSFAQFIDDMIITGVGGAANGFDQTHNNSAGAWTYNNGYVATPHINTAVNIGRGAYLFYRGNRDNFQAKTNSPFLDAESIVMTYKGILNQQNVTVPLVHGSTGYSLIGNPYAAIVDWNAVIKTSNVATVVRHWNPSNRQYATFNGYDGINGGSRYIGPGQSVFVQTTDNNSPTITFTEASKVSSQYEAPKTMMAVGHTSSHTTLNKSAIMMVAGENMMPTEPARIRLQLLKEGAENSDEALVVLNGAEAGYAQNDVLRYGGEGVFLSTLSTDGKELAINYMPEVSYVSNIKLSINVATNGSYQLQFALSDIPVGYEVKLRDRYLNTITDVSAQGTIYALTIDRSVAASFGADRFEIMLAPPTTLPVVISAFTANKVNEGVLLKWATASENNNSHFEVQRAGEDKLYTNVGSLSANSQGLYSLLDKAPLNGNNYYRLVQVDKDGKSTTSNPVVVKYELNTEATAGISLYPTLVVSDFTVKYHGTLSAARYLLKITDVTGRLIANHQIDKQALADGYKGSLASGTTGVYFAELVDVSANKSLGSLKFVKK